MSRRRSGPLRERDFRLLFDATTITTFGDRLGGPALVFAVLDLPGGNATKLGIVLAARQVVEALVVVAGGVLADRLPRSVILVGASLLQGTAQAATAWYRTRPPAASCKECVKAEGVAPPIASTA